MASRLDYAKADRQARTDRALHEFPAAEADYHPPADLGPTAHVTSNGVPVHHHGWRTEWDGEPFPVTITYTTTMDAAAESEDG